MTSGIDTAQKRDLEGQSLTLGLLVTAELKVLATLQNLLVLGLAGCALHAQGDLLGGLGLFAEHGLGLSTVARLLTVVATLPLGVQASLAGLVLGDLLGGVLFALFAKSVACLGDVNLGKIRH